MAFTGLHGSRGRAESIHCCEPLFLRLRHGSDEAVTLRGLRHASFSHPMATTLRCISESFQEEGQGQDREWGGLPGASPISGIFLPASSGSTFTCPPRPHTAHQADFHSQGEEDRILLPQSPHLSRKMFWVPIPKVPSTQSQALRSQGTPKPHPPSQPGKAFPSCASILLSAKDFASTANN